MPSRDFEFVAKLMEEFFLQRKIQKSLAVIEDYRISAWEPWWQVEFATFLSEHEGKHECRREKQVKVDRRKEKEKNKFIVDFIVRPRNHVKGKFILLEFKQHWSVKSCITNMAKDVLKVDKAKVTSINQRSFWGVGVHPKESKKKIREMVKSTAIKYDLELYDVRIKFIPNTGFAFTIF